MTCNMPPHARHLREQMDPAIEDGICAGTLLSSYFETIALPTQVLSMLPLPHSTPYSTFPDLILLL